MKHKIALLMLVLAATFLSMPQPKVAAYTYRLAPGVEHNMSGGGCTIKFTYATRPGNIAVAKFYPTNSACGGNTRLKVKSTGPTGYGTLCNYPPSIRSDCAEGIWSASKDDNAWALGAQMTLCGYTCVDHTVLLP